ncbi:hypothetical protein [Saliphagus sp. LR7]|uniref:hypothetical protein n=1 Tax=Saliphagus sp. LR7 TaxID=2282654 RepID=UPI000DF7BDBB|nr:hypothetical protein [Saliphagus sp. LR7]
MVSLTFIELHLDGNTQFGPKRIGEATIGEDDGAEDEEEAAAAEDGGGKPVGVVVGLLVLVALGLAIRKFRGDDDGEFEEFEPADEPDVVVD